MVSLIGILPMYDYRVNGLLRASTKFVMGRSLFSVGLVDDSNLVGVIKLDSFGIGLDLNLVALLKALLMTGTLLVETHMGPGPLVVVPDREATLAIAFVAGDHEFVVAGEEAMLGIKSAPLMSSASWIRERDPLGMLPIKSFIPFILPFLIAVCMVSFLLFLLVAVASFGRVDEVEGQDFFGVVSDDECPSISLVDSQTGQFQHWRWFCVPAFAELLWCVDGP